MYLEDIEDMIEQIKEDCVKLGIDYYDLPPITEDIEGFILFEFRLFLTDYLGDKRIIGYKTP